MRVGYSSIFITLLSFSKIPVELIKTLGNYQISSCQAAWTWIGTEIHHKGDIFLLQLELKTIDFL